MFASKDALFAKSSGGYQISRSLRFRSSASAYLSKATFATPTDNKKWTWSAWVKIGTINPWAGLFYGGGIGTSQPLTELYLYTDGTLYYQTYNGSVNTGLLQTTQVFRDPSAWYHIVLVIDIANATANNRQRIYVNGAEVTAFSSRTNHGTSDATYFNNASYAGYIGESFPVSGTAAKYFDGYLAEVNFIDGQALTPSSFGAFDTNGVWQPKSYTGTYGTNGFYLPFTSNGTAPLLGINTAQSSNYFAYSEQFDNAYWTKLNTTVSANTTDTTDPLGGNTADRFTWSSAGNSYVYRNGAATVSGTNSYVLSVYLKAGTVSSASLYIGSSGGADGGIGTYTLTGSGSATFTSINSSSGSVSIQSVGNGWYRCVLYCLGGNGANSGVLDAGSTGTIYAWGAQLQLGTVLGSYLQTTTAAIINDWTPNNISVTSGTTYDSMIDSPTNAVGGNGIGNYAVLNPLIKWTGTYTLANGNLDLSTTNPNAGYSFSSIGMTSGKWYAEFTATVANTLCGVWGNGNTSMVSSGYPTYYWDIGAYSGGTTLTLEKSSGTASGTLGTITAGDIYGVAVDIDNTTIYFYKNGSLVQTVTGMTFTGPLYFVIGIWSSSVSSNNSVNFGQIPFRGMYVSGSGSSYVGTGAPPSNFSALNTQNLPTPTIAAGNKYFDVVTRGGTGGVYTKTGLGFQPDFAWTKLRNTAYNHYLQDAVRGVAKQLSSDTTTAEQSITNAYTAFNADGYTLGSSTAVNDALYTYVDWLWKGGNGTVSNTSGSITSTVSANTSAGFSVVTYTGTGANATFGHGLGVTPGLVIIKNRSAATDWFVWHSSIAGYYLLLNSTSAQIVQGSVYPGNPWSAGVNIGTSNITNGSGNNHVAYCFAPVSSFSAFGSFVGNGSSDGPMIFTNFRPRWLMYKNTTTAGYSWIMLDSSRSTINVSSDRLLANTSDSEASGTHLVDFLSNGFKIRNTDTNGNASGSTYIYAAFAENPFKTSRAR